MSFGNWAGFGQKRLDLILGMPIIGVCAFDAHLEK
jgi:hypothetical protein